MFEHTTSRTGDPQLHTHALVVNKVVCADGAWRTLDGHEIYHHKKAAGAIYQATLRAELTSRLPVQFGAVNQHGQAELSGAPPELLAAWSSRTRAVMAEATPTIATVQEGLGHPVTAAQRARIIKTAVLATRPAKDSTSSEADLRSLWRTQAADLGWDQPTVTRALGQTPAPAAPGPGWEQRVITDAVLAVGRSTAIWSGADLAVQVAARIPTHPDAVTSAGGVAKLVQELTARATGAGADAGVVGLGACPDGATARVSDPRYASTELVHMEARILERVTEGGYRHPDRPHPHLGPYLADPALGLSREQGQAVVKLVTSNDLVTVMVAPAGAGKTRTLGAAAAVWAGMQRRVVALAPSARAAAELSAATGTRGHTVASYLDQLDHDDPDSAAGPVYYPFGGPVVIVDEASMLSTADLDRLTAHATTTKSTVILVGDPAQIGAVNTAGGMLEVLAQRFGPRVMELSELHRFAHPWEAAATLRLRVGDATVLTEYVEQDRVHPAADSELAADAVFAQWQHATSTGRDAVMLARSWADVTALNTRARTAAITAGAITGPDLLVVTSRTASSHDHPEHRGWRAGDLLITKRNTPTIRIGVDAVRNGDRFEVLTATTTDPTGSGAGLVVRDLAGRGTTVLPAAYLARHVEYGWAATIDGAQGTTAEVAIVLARTGLDREHLYVAMTRGRAENHVHTTPELLTGDAGPHHLTTASTAPGTGSRMGAGRRGQVDGQLTLPDLDAAVDQLTRAMASTGKERAAHTLLDAHVERVREAAWAQQQADRPPGPVPTEHRRHYDQLQAAIGHEQQTRLAAEQLSTDLHHWGKDLERVPFWSRGCRQELTGQITRGQDRLRQLVEVLDQASTQVNALTELMHRDSDQRYQDDAGERARQDQDGAHRPHTPYLDPNTLIIPTAIPREHIPPQHFREPQDHTPSRPDPGHVLQW